MPGILLRSWKRFAANTRGAFQIEFALMFPLLLVLSFGVLEFALLAFDYQRVAEATRRAARFVIINKSIPNTANLLDGAVIQCTSSDGTVECVGGSPSDDPKTDEQEASVRFQAMLATMQKIYPPVQETNVRVIYESTDVGTTDSIGGIIPLVTVEIIDVQYEFYTGGFIGVTAITLPGFRTSILGSGRTVDTS